MSHISPSASTILRRKIEFIIIFHIIWFERSCQFGNHAIVPHNVCSCIVHNRIVATAIAIAASAAKKLTAAKIVNPFKFGSVVFDFNFFMISIGLNMQG